MNTAIQVVINGEAREVPGNAAVTALLEQLGLDAGRVAIERNLEILPKARWHETIVQPGDRFEIVQFVGGG